MENLISVNPADPDEIVGTYPVTEPALVQNMVSAARAAQDSWSRESPRARARILAALPHALERATEEFAAMICAETGKPITEARDEVADAARESAYLISRAEHVLATPSSDSDTDGGTTHTLRWCPMGVSAVITPFNHPLEIACWGIVSNLLCGNAVVHKPSELTPGVGSRLGELLAELDMPTGVFQVALGATDVGRALVRADLDLIWFVGSSSAGRQVLTDAASGIKKCLLELGGSSPFVVFADCPLTESLYSQIINSRFYNCGQVCSAGKRLFVEDSIHDKVVADLTPMIAGLRVGDPTHPDTRIGPLSSHRQQQAIKRQVDDARDRGARILCGGTRPANLRGYYYMPTLIADATQDMLVMQEEVFGPVLPVSRFSTSDELVALINGNPYGLSAEIFGGDRSRCMSVAERIHAGRVLINSPKSPGIVYPLEPARASGLGRHQGDWFLRETCTLKYIKASRPPST